MNSTSTNKTSESQGTLDLQISDPVSMLNEIARRYESTERILMEYVDNALDDAEVLFRENNKAYPQEVKIELIIDYPNRAVTIRDNCRGMEKETLERIVRNVGESQKRGVTWVNGRFGFGVQAFRAAADVIHFQTKHAAHPHFVLDLQRDQHHGIPGARPVAEAFPSDSGTGTIVRLDAFEEEWFENVTAVSIKEEIESHFERLLARPNLTILVSEAGDAPLRCEPFRYRDLPGQAIQRTLKMEYKGNIYPVEIHLKIADVEVPGRTVRFFARGRRINQVSEIKSFIRKSKYRTSVWGHPHLLGYIEVGEIVRPVITRDDFVRNKSRVIFYDGILGLEEEIKNALDRINEAQRDSTLSRLEDVLRDVLETIARQDRRQLRLHTQAQRQRRAKSANSNTLNGLATSNEQGAELNQSGPGLARPDFQAETGSTGSEFQNSTEWQLADMNYAGGPSGAAANDSFSAGDQAEDSPANSGSSIWGENSGSQAVGPSPGRDDEVEFSYEKQKAEDSAEKTQRRRYSFDIQFFDIPPDHEGQVKRSYLIGSTIYINVGHPDFQDRMIYTRQGQPKVTDRLGAYIAATVSIHYKDQFYVKYGYEPDRRDLLFDEQVDFIFRLEAALRDHLPALERELARQTAV